LGYTDEEIGNDLEEWSSRVHPEDLERVLAAVQAQRRPADDAAAQDRQPGRADCGFRCPVQTDRPLPFLYMFSNRGQTPPKPHSLLLRSPSRFPGGYGVQRKIGLMFPEQIPLFPHRPSTPVHQSGTASFTPSSI
ncbi:MAG: hypothetical protein D6762_00465, partial [Candidatus Neomarinimicrobiota bacterium]